MILTAQDIQSKQFHVRFRGFDVEEVDDFLEKIATLIQSFSEENQTLKGRLETMEKELATYHNQQKSFQNAIIAAQNVADAMKEKSRQEAENIVAEAQEEARLRRNDAELEIAELKRKIGELKSLREQARHDLRQQLESYLHMLETEPADNARAVEHFNLPTRPQPPEPDDSRKAAPQTSPNAEAEPARQRPDNHPASSEEEDFADLYVKIDIPASGPASVAREADHEFKPRDIDLPPSFDASKELLVMDEDEYDHEKHGLPDLEGDMVFNLEDPLDLHEPAVSFSENLEEAKKKKGAHFNPDESPL
ncbi:MAG: DivIVA domain-containing protein [Desulfurivibrionaceae bacterium]